MSDQADTLRKLMQSRAEIGAADFPETVLFAGGGRGTGTSFLMFRLGSELAGEGKKVLLIDQAPLEGQGTAPRGLTIHSASVEAGGWNRLFVKTGGMPDLLFLNHDDLGSLPRLPKTCVIVTLPDPAYLRESVRLIRSLRARQPRLRLSVIVNRVASPGEARQTYLRLRDSVLREAAGEIAYLGHYQDRCAGLLAKRLAGFSSEPSTG